MKKETKEATMAGSSGSFSAPMGFVTKKEIYKIHNKKKYNDEEDIQEQEGEFTEATTTATSAAGAYDAPFGTGKKNPLKIDGPDSIKKRMKTMRKKNFPMWGGPDGQYVKVKEKCKKYPYCNQGDVNALEFYENEKLNESVKKISEKYGLPIKEVEKSVIKEIKDIFIEYESFGTK
jgi:hypothetical protein